MRANGHTGNGKPKTFTEEIEVPGNHLVVWVDHLFRDNTVRQIRVKAPGGQIELDLRATGDLAGNGAPAAALSDLWLGMLGSVAALVPYVMIEIERFGEAPGETIAALWDGEDEHQGQSTRFQAVETRRNSATANGRRAAIPAQNCTPRRASADQVR